MNENRLDYETLVADALRGVIRQVLDQVSRRGLPGDHHFYLSFRTAVPEVRIPARLHEQFPERMTIVLQHQFHDLVVDDRGFAVTLSFGGKPERLSVPFTAIEAFVDPSVNFGLPIPGPGSARPDASQAPSSTPAETPAASVVSLDQFRKR